MIQNKSELFKLLKNNFPSHVFLIKVWLKSNYYLVFCEDSIVS